MRASFDWRPGKTVILPVLLFIGLACNTFFGLTSSMGGKEHLAHAAIALQNMLGENRPWPTITPLKTLTALPAEGASGSTLTEGDLARTINAQIPFMPQAAVPARGFLWANSSLDRERATDCLAATGYYEAGLDPGEQRAVMQVVLNRVRHSAFPRTVCGVVFQGSERFTGCQFTFTCDGAMLRRQPSQASWQQAKRVALEMLTGRVEPIVGNATHYHTNWVHPRWSSQMQKIAVVDTHLFFRWPGSTGDPQAFGNIYSGGEPQIARMASLSFAHRGSVLQDRYAFDAPSAHAGHPVGEGSGRNAIHTALPNSSQSQGTGLGSSIRREVLPDRAEAPGADVILASLDTSMDPDSFLRRAEQSCSGKANCRFLGWTNPARKADRFPVSGASIDALSFSYIRHGTDDPGKARWNCSEFPRSDRTQCLRRGK